MQSVRINEYASVQDYCSSSPVCTPRIEPLQTADLWRYAITTGGVSGRSLSARSVPFYRDLVTFALEERLSPVGDYLYCQTDDYAASETSLKSVVSFLLGMIGAHVIAEKRYGAPRRQIGEASRPRRCKRRRNRAVGKHRHPLAALLCLTRSTNQTSFFPSSLVKCPVSPGWPRESRPYAR